MQGKGKKTQPAAGWQHECAAHHTGVPLRVPGHQWKFAAACSGPRRLVVVLDAATFAFAHMADLDKGDPVGAPATGQENEASETEAGEAAAAAAVLPDAEGRRPTRERKQVERIRSSTLTKTQQKRASTEGKPTVKKGKNKGKRASGGGSDQDEGDLDLPISELSAKDDKPKKKAKTGAGSAGKVGKKPRQTQSEEEDDGPDRDSEEAIQIRSELLDLCDELPEETLQETSAKQLRRKLEKRLGRDEGDLDEWKGLIKEWYLLADECKTELRKFLRACFDKDADDMPTPKAIRRFLETQLELDEGDLDSWKRSIDGWIGRIMEELEDMQSPLGSPKGKSHAVECAGTVDGVAALAPAAEVPPPAPDTVAPRQDVENEAKKKRPPEQGSAQGDIAASPEKKRKSSTEQKVTEALPGQVGGGEAGGGKLEQSEMKRKKGEQRGEGKESGKDIKVDQSGRKEEKRKSTDAKQDWKEGREKERAGDVKEKEKDRSEKRGKEKASAGNKDRHSGGGSGSEQTEASARPLLEPKVVPLDNSSSKLLERRASLKALNTGKESPSLLQVTPCYETKQRESSEANEYRACALEDLDALTKVVEAAEQKRAEEEKLRAQRELEVS